MRLINFSKNNNNLRFFILAIATIIVVVMFTFILVSCKTKLPDDTVKPADNVNREGELLINYVVFGYVHDEYMSRADESYQLWVPEEREKFEFGGWYFDDLCTTPATLEELRDITEDEVYLYALMIINDPVTVQYTFDGEIKYIDSIPRGSSVDSIYIDQDLIPTHHFYGWCFDQALTQIYQLGVPIYEDTVLYGKFLSIEGFEKLVNVTFETNGGERISDITVNAGTVLELPEPHDAGYVFAGWYADENFKYLYPLDNVVVQDITLYASWTKSEDEFSVRFHTNSQQEIADLVCPYDQLVSYSTLPTPTLVGDHFLGWYVDPYFETKFTSVRMLNNIDLYAKWEKAEAVDGITYTVTFVEVKTVSDKFYKNDTNYLYTPIVDVDYKFEGWFLDPEFTVPFSLVPLKSDLTLYAKIVYDGIIADDMFEYKLSADGSYYSIIDYYGGVDVLIPNEYNNKPIKEIGGNCFSYKAITSLTLGSNIKYIGYASFMGTHLAHLVIPQNVEYVETSAFSEMPFLKDIVVEGNTRFGESIFENDKLLTSFVGLSVECAYARMFYGCNSLNTVELGNLSEIFRCAFENCTSLQTVSYNPLSLLTKIGFNSFYNTPRLLNFEFNSSIREVESYAFNRSGIECVVLDGVVEIGGMAFAECKNLTTVSVGAYLRDLGSMTFFASQKIESINIHMDNPKYKVVNGVVFNQDQSVLVYYPANKSGKSYTIPSQTREIGICAMSYCGELEELNISSNTTIINSLAFLGTSFNSINVDSGNSAYKTDDNGNLVSLDETVLYKYVEKADVKTYVANYKVIATGAFSNTTLEKIIFGINVESIEQYAVSFDNSITAISVMGTSQIQSYAFSNIMFLSSLVTVVEYSSNIVEDCPLLSGVK